MTIKKGLTFLSAALLVSAASVNANAQQYRFVALDNTTETKICVMAGSNDVTGIKRAIGKEQLSRYLVANGFRCNDISIAKFAFKYNASDSLAYFDRYARGKNKAETKVRISDIAMQAHSGEQEPILVYVGKSK